MPNLRAFTYIFVLLSVFFLLPGCGTYKAMDEQQALITQLEQEKTTLQKQATQVNAAVVESDKQVKDLELRENVIRQSIVQVSNQLASATGPVFEALSQTLAQLQDQRRVLLDQANASATQAAKYVGLQAQVAAQIKLTDDALVESQARIDTLQTNIQSQADGVGNLIKKIGGALQSYGVPGAQPAADTASDLWGGLAAVLVAAGTGGTLLFRKKANDAQKAGQQIAESIQFAKQQSTKFKYAFDEVTPLLKGYQDTAAQNIVMQAKAAVPA